MDKVIEIIGGNMKRDLAIVGWFVTDTVSLCTQHALQVARSKDPNDLTGFFQPRLGEDGPVECPACKHGVRLAGVGYERWHNWPYGVELFLCRLRSTHGTEYICWNCGTLTTDRAHTCNGGES